jgi:hypothetical protein
MPDLDFSTLPGGPAMGRGVQIHYSKSHPQQHNVMVYHRDGTCHRVFGPTPDLAEAKRMRDTARRIIDAACMVQALPLVHSKE